MPTLSIDIESFSSVDIKKSGLYKYVQSPDFEILLFAFSLDGSAVEIVDLAQGERLNRDLADALRDPSLVKRAYNAAFEWYCLSKFIDTPLEQWRCTMVHGLYCGYTAGLAQTAVAVGLPEDKRKMGVGGSLIRTFCLPCIPTAKNGYRTRTLPRHEPDKWNLFKDYCKQDVVTEMAVEKRLAAFPVPEQEERLWQLDQAINARGIATDAQMIEGAMEMDAKANLDLTAEAIRISGLANPKSVRQLSTWLSEEIGEDVTDLRKTTVSTLLTTVDEGSAKRMLEIRQEISKTSVRKYAAMEAARGEDGRVRGMLQFYGANRTGRWAGRIVQVQNLPQNHLPALRLARELVQTKQSGAIRLLYGNVHDTLSQLIRTAFVAQKGHRLLIADFSAIEARVLAWLSGEQWRIDVFASHGRIYEASASQMFGVPIESIKKGYPHYELRQKGKVAELALGYGGGSNALIHMGALEKGIEEEELPEIVSRWRRASKRIVDLWYACENAAIEVIRTGMPVVVRGLLFAREAQAATGQDFLTIKLPSGRKLYYVKPYLVKNDRGKDALQYWGVDQDTKKWGTVSTWGGKIVENACQSIARDCLAQSLVKLDQSGYPTVMHVHDEIICEMPDGTGSLEEMIQIMTEPIPWAPGLLLKAEGFETDFYQKGD